MSACGVPDGKRGRARERVALLCLLAWLAATLLAACGGSTSAPASAFGGALNHLHDVLALRGTPNTVLLATHIGLYRSSDGGATWKVVAAGDGQPMAGLMTFKLAQSAVDPKRVYCLALPRTGAGAPPPASGAAQPGLYTSDDAGQTWRLATPATAFPSPSLYTIGAGSGGPGQVYAVLSSLGPSGVFVSDDAGAHWRQLPKVPADPITGITGDPTHPGHVFLFSSSTGVSMSANGGKTWAHAPGISGGIYVLSLAGNTIYAGGDTGLFVSRDGGTHFALADGKDTFSILSASPSAPATAYALTGTAVFRTTDAGKTWKQAAPTSQHPGLITVDPSDAATAYVGFSYPLGVAVTTDAGQSWRTVAH
jgi:photosystem II stability/assembly factor-like uncharacterized protein